MLIHTSSSSVSTESYYGRRPDPHNYTSTADSRDFSSSAAPPPSLPQPDCRDDCCSSPPLQPNPEPEPFTCSNNKRKRKRSSLNQEIVNKLNMEIVVMFDSFLNLYSLDTDFDFDITGLEKVIQYIFENCKEIIREYEKDFKHISAICKDFAIQGKVLLLQSKEDICSFSDTEKEVKKKKKTLDINFKGVYLCKECDRAFDDFRALGGHRAGHNRQKRAAAAEAVGADSDGSSNLCLNEQKNKGYACNLCPRIFSTGQALGGHKTYHRRIAECGGQVETLAEKVLCHSPVSSVVETSFSTGQELGGHKTYHQKLVECAGKVETQAETVLCPSPVSSVVETSFSTGQELGGHRTYHQKIVECAGKVETQAETDLCSSPDSSVVENSVVLTIFDLNAPPDEGLWGCV